jgi:hypothetical protein
VAYLIPGSPLAEADDQHAEGPFTGPESVSLTRLYGELVVDFGSVCLAVYLQVGTVIEEVE